MELCRGIDLDEKLKKLKSLPEKDSRLILMQILSGLKYLHNPVSFSSFNLWEEMYYKHITLIIF